MLKMEQKPKECSILDVENKHSIKGKHIRLDKLLPTEQNRLLFQFPISMPLRYNAIETLNTISGQTYRHSHKILYKRAVLVT